MKNNQEIAVEVCAYSLFSCLAADRAGANRVELCASPYEGGTTPSTGLVKQVLAHTSIEVHAMLRPRGGDFCYDASEKQTMLAEASDLVAAGVHGLVVGALLPNGDLDVAFLAEIKRIVGGVALTCHRAIDVSRDPFEVMEGLIQLGFVRILSSGQKDKAMEGIEALAEMVERADGRIQIMAGSGVNPQNCAFFKQIGVNAIHLSARTVRNSMMEYRRPGISMGGVSEISEFEVAFASEEIIRQAIQQIRSN
ncbi:copper homeostasis protein CutC [Aquirufa sp.]|jgi:copper homeostasis protein|uniref:copper homeostasis protein CutC n=1 Tax=Aquirufa sp. TaxID=2676249 RepID=UPI0037C0B177